MAANYEILWQTPGGVTLGWLERIHECVYARTENDAGEISLSLPDRVYDESWFQPFSRVLIYRYLPGLNGYLDLETPWYILDGPYFELDEDGTEIIRLGGTDALGLALGGANVAYNDNNTYTLKLDEADDMLKAVMRENRGSLATDTDRDLSTFLTVEPDASAAPIIRYGSFARQQVLSVLQGITQASANDETTPTWLGFDVVADPEIGNPLIFRSYVSQRGNDHRFPGGSPPRLLSAVSGSLAQVRVGTNYREMASVIYAGGPGVESIRSIVTAQDDALLALSPLSRVERFVDGSQITDPDALTAFARAELRRARPRRTFEARLVETENMRRGVHWDYGDYLTAEHRNLTYDVRVEKLAVRLTPGPDGGLIDETDTLLRGDESA